MLIIDDIAYDVKCEVKRTANLTSSDISGLLLDKNYFNDVIGTYMSYQVTLKYPLRDQSRYAELYEALTLPVDGHRFNLPFNQGRLDITARIASVPDQWIELDGGFQYWEALQFTIVANHPSKTMALEEVVSRGRAPVPDIAAPNEGDTFVWTEGHWAKSAEYPNADVLYY